jgi:hypothetical protein
MNGRVRRKNRFSISLAKDTRALARIQDRPRRRKPGGNSRYGSASDADTTSEGAARGTATSDLADRPDDIFVRETFRRAVDEEPVARRLKRRPGGSKRNLHAVQIAKEVLRRSTGFGRVLRGIYCRSLPYGASFPCSSDDAAMRHCALLRYHLAWPDHSSSIHFQGSTQGF